MARIEKVVNVKVNTKDAVSETEKLTSAIESLAKSQKEANDQAKKTAEEAKKKLEEQKKATIEARKPLNRLKAGFKSLGTAIKATGIGLLVAGVAKLTMAFSSNSVVSTKLKEVWETINLVFGDFATAIVSAVQEVGKANGEFDSLKKVISNTVTLGLTPLKIVLGALKLSFFSIKKTINELQLAWEKSWLGGRGKDKERIKELEDSIMNADKAINESRESIEKTGKDGFKAFKKYAENIGGAIDEVAKVTEKSIKNVSKISIEESNKQAKALVELRGETRLAIANNELILKTKQKEAELQRQIRDDVELDVDTRIKANNELKKILEDSNKLQIANAQKAIDLAKLEVQASNGSIDSQEQLIRAQLAYQDVLETTAGFVSEQKTNRASLNSESIELEQSALDAQKERQLDQLEFEAEQEEKEANKIIKLQERLDLENEKLKEDLERKRQLFAEGTQARIDAEQEFLTAKQELDQKEIQLEEQKRQVRLKTFDDLQTLAGKETKASQALFLIKQGLALKELLLEAKKTIAFSKLGLAKSTTAVAEGTAQTAKVGFPQNIPLLIGFAAQAAGIIGAIKSATSAADSVSSEFGASGGGGGSAPQVTAPSFNLVSGTGTDQIADTIQNQDRPIKAFVVSNDVTSGQELDRNAVEGATL